MEFDQPKVPAHGPLEGEDIGTEHWEDARHWMSIYDDPKVGKTSKFEDAN
ncbi:MAG: hypothetical protein ACLPYY_21455 [Acidimicrobiales bacterium]